MRTKLAIAILVGALIVLGAVTLWRTPKTPPSPVARRNIVTTELPKPTIDGGMTLTEALAKRRSVRSFTGQPLNRDQIAQLCWAAQGITHPIKKYRTAPSAGALYPLRVYVATANGLFAYIPDGHAFEVVASGDLLAPVAKAANQKWIASAGAVFILCGNMSIAAGKYRDRAERYVWQETGHVAENLLLQATALGLGATPAGAFGDAKVKELLHLPKGWQPMFLVPVGIPKTKPLPTRPT